MNDHDELGVSIAGVALRLEDEHERDLLADYRRRRCLTEGDEGAYVAGLEVGRAWVAEAASALALRQAWRLAEHRGPWRALPDFAAELQNFLVREVEESRRQTRYARFDPQLHSWDDESPYIAGIIDVAGAAWAALRELDPARAAELANPYAPANRAAYLATFEDDRDPEFRRLSDEVRGEMQARGQYDGSPTAVRCLVSEVWARLAGTRRAAPAS